MGSPNIDKSLEDNKKAIDAAHAASEAALKSLDNTEKSGIDYINAHTKGIIQKLDSNSLYYSKFSDDFSLDALNGIIDSTVSVIVDAIKAEAGDESPDLAESSAKDVGDLVKGVLSLAAASSSTTTKVQITFSYIVAGDNNFAVYYGYNSTTCDAQNVWGNKDIKVIANTYVVAQVNPNPDITRAQMLQKDLNTLKKINDKYDDALVNATCQEEVDALKFRQNEMKDLEEKINKELEKTKAAE